MAGLGMLLGGALANALAFTGSNALFSSLQGSSIAAERKRHDEAIEATQRAQGAWVRERQDRIDAISWQLRQEQHSETTFTSLDRALAVYRDIMGACADPSIAKNDIGLKPTFTDFYHPSEAQKECEYAFVALAMAGGAAAGKLLI